MENLFFENLDFFDNTGGFSFENTPAFNQPVPDFFDIPLFNFYGGRDPFDFTSSVSIPEIRRLKPHQGYVTEFIMKPPVKLLSDTTSKRGPYRSNKEYVETMYPCIYKALVENGIDPEKWTPYCIAQTALESGWGNEFSRRTNNYGGMKGKGSGEVKTKEWSPSRGYYTIYDEFKTFSSILEFADFFVKRLKNKFKAFDGSVDNYLSNIKQHGYFTAPLSSYSKAFQSNLRQIQRILENV